MTFAQLDVRNKSQISLLLFTALFLVIFAIELYEADIVGSYVEEHQFLDENVLGKLGWHVEDFLEKA